MNQSETWINTPQTAVIPYHFEQGMFIQVNNRLCKILQKGTSRFLIRWGHPMFVFTSAKDTLICFPISSNMQEYNKCPQKYYLIQTSNTDSGLHKQSFIYCEEYFKVPVQYVRRVFGKMYFTEQLVFRQQQSHRHLQRLHNSFNHKKDLIYE